MSSVYLINTSLPFKAYVVQTLLSKHQEPLPARTLSIRDIQVVRLNPLEERYALGEDTVPLEVVGGDGAWGVHAGYLGGEGAVCRRGGGR